MAIIRDDQRTRYEVPHEPGEWVELRPLRNGDMIGVDLAGDGYAGSIALLERVITGWSYDAPVSPEMVRMLDMRTTTWLSGVLASEITGDVAEKNESATSS